MQQQAIEMRHSFRAELLFSLEVGFLENDISFYRNYYKTLSKLFTTTKINIVINNNNINNNYTKTTHTGLQINTCKDIDG